MIEKKQSEIRPGRIESDGMRARNAGILEYLRRWPIAWPGVIARNWSSGRILRCPVRRISFVKVETERSSRSRCKKTRMNTAWRMNFAFLPRRVAQLICRCSKRKRDLSARGQLPSHIADISTRLFLRGVYLSTRPDSHRNLRSVQRRCTWTNSRRKNSYFGVHSVGLVIPFWEMESLVDGDDAWVLKPGCRLRLLSSDIQMTRRHRTTLYTCKI